MKVGILGSGTREHSCETRELPHSEMLTTMRIIDSLLADWGVKLG